LRVLLHDGTSDVADLGGTVRVKVRVRVGVRVRVEVRARVRVGVRVLLQLNTPRSDRTECCVVSTLGKGQGIGRFLEKKGGLSLCVCGGVLCVCVANTVMVKVYDENVVTETMPLGMGFVQRHFWELGMFLSSRQGIWFGLVVCPAILAGLVRTLTLTLTLTKP
jgi:hypothetical protein